MSHEPTTPTPDTTASTRRKNILRISATDEFMGFCSFTKQDPVAVAEQAIAEFINRKAEAINPIFTGAQS